MTETLISLVSILIGIIGANSLGHLFKKYSFGIIGNTIAGVFGSIFLIKILGKLGFDPSSIVQSDTMFVVLFCVNCIISFIGGVLGLVLAYTLKNKLN